MVTFCTYYIAWILGGEGRGENGDCSRSVVRTVSTGCETPQCAASWMLLLYAGDSSRWLLTPSPQFLSRGAQTFWHRARAYKVIDWISALCCPPMTYLRTSSHFERFETTDESSVRKRWPLKLFLACKCSVLIGHDLNGQGSTSTAGY